MSPKEYVQIYMKSLKVGCNAKWYDGIFGWAWHCGCEDGKHMADQQCSILTMESLDRK